MLSTTQDAVKAVLRADPSLTPGDRTRILNTIRNHAKADSTPPTPEPPRLLRRAEVARRLARSVRSVDELARRGVLKKAKLPGRVRAAGFLESDVTALLVAVVEGGTAQ